MANLLNVLEQLSGKYYHNAQVVIVEFFFLSKLEEPSREQLSPMS